MREINARSAARRLAQRDLNQDYNPHSDHVVESLYNNSIKGLNHFYTLKSSILFSNGVCIVAKISRNSTQPMSLQVKVKVPRDKNSGPKCLSLGRLLTPPTRISYTTPYYYTKI